MSNEEMRTLAGMVADTLIARGVAAPVPSGLVPRRLSVEQFAVCVAKCREVVLRRIRERFIDRVLVEGPPYFIDRSALKKFNVTLEVAAERLQRAAAAAAPSRPAIPVPVPQPSPA